MALIRLRHVTTRKIAEFDVERQFIRTGEQTAYLLDLQALVLSRILSSDGVTRHADIEAMLARNNVGGDADTNTKSSKFKFELTEVLEKIGLAEIIALVRGKGYRRHPQWVLESNRPSADTVVDTKLVRLRRICQECIELMETVEIVRMVNGVQYVEIDHSKAVQRTADLDDILWTLIEELASSTNHTQIKTIKDHFDKLLTYVLFWRIGDNLEPNKWRQDYKDEITNCVRNIEIHVQALREKMGA